MFFNNKDSHNEIHPLNQATTLEISESSQLDTIFSKTGSETSSTYNPLSGIIKMKQQAKNAVSLFFFATLLMSGAVSAGILYDIENNSSKANQTGVFYKGNARLEVRGHVSNTDKVDLYSIKDDGTSNKINWGFYPDSGSTRMYVYKDVNRNKKHDSSDAFLFSLSKKEYRKDFYSFRGSMYIVMIHNTSAPGKNYYAMSASAPMTVKLNVISAKSYGTFDGSFRFGSKNSSKPDFYVKTRINYGSSRKSKTVGNNNTPVFNHKHTGTLYPFGGIIPFSIDLYDSDRSSRDDQANIHPTRAELKRLDLVYDLVRNQIRTDTGKVLGKPGQAITVRGLGIKLIASVTFVVR